MTDDGHDELLLLLLLPLYLLSAVHEALATLLTTIIYKLLFSKCLPRLTASAINLRGGVSLFFAKRTLLFLVLDFLSDIYTATHHFQQGRTAAGILTVLIIVGSGLIVTIIVRISTYR